MNQEITTAFEYALLARAAYANLKPDSNIINILTDADPALNSNNGWSAALAEYFASKFTVIASELNGLENYQGVFFKRTGTDEYILANRGTKELYIDLVISDALLAGTGITTQLIGLETFIEETRLAHNITSFSVTGHSLGGYLSTMTKSMYGDMISGLYTYNGAGIADIAFTGNLINLLKQVFGYEPTSFATPNAIDYRTAEMPDVVVGTGIYLGTAQRINVDDIVLLGHGMAPITDTLAVYNLLGMVDSDITINQLNAVKEASSSQGFTTNADVKNDNDALVKAFGALLTKSLTVFQQTTKDKVNLLNVTANDNNAMHEAIFALVTDLAATPQSLNIVPLVSVAANGTPHLQLATQNLNSLAYRYALKELNSFVVEGLNYSSFNQNGELNDYNEECRSPQGLRGKFQPKQRFMALTLP